MESSKKRSRKSKLVPRTCLDSDDENIADMQNEIEQTIARMTSNSILKKLSRHTEEPLKFSIKVEVEEVDEPTNTQIKQEETERELNISIDSVVSLKKSNIDDIKENNLKSLLEKTSSPAAVLSKGPELLQCILNEEMIRKEFNRISKQTTSKADKLIEIHILNFYGRYLTEIELDDKEMQLKSVIAKWKKWHKLNPKYRNVLLSYKCYICSKAWWHYYDFSQHFLTHDQAKLDIQTCGQECNIIAYQNKQPDYDIPIEETCWRCGQDYTVHQVTEKGNKIYRCKGCLKKFTTCMRLNQHFGNCEFIKKTLNAEGVKTNNVFSCKLCPVKYFSDLELEKHLKTRHSVRSDLPAVIHVKNCPTCSRKAIDGHSHECINLLFTNDCKFCKRNFQNASNLQMHQTVIKKYHKCTVCGKILLSECMELKHLLSHSNTYTMVYKCKLCPNSVYFLSELMMKNHRFTCHKGNNIYINTGYFETIVVPKTLLKNTTFKTYLPKVKPNSNNYYQYWKDNSNTYDGYEMEPLDFNEFDSQNDTADEYMTESIKGEINININKAITKIEAVSTNIDDVATNIDEVATNIDEVEKDINEIATNINEVATNIDEVEKDINEIATNINEVATNIDEVKKDINEIATNIDEVATNHANDIQLKNIEPLNIKIKEEKPDIEEFINNEYPNEIIVKQEQMEIDFNINYFNEDNINDMVVKEEIIEHVVKVCNLNNDIKIQVKDEPMNDHDYDMRNNDSENNDTMNNDTTNNDTNDEDFKLLYTSRIYSCRKCPYKGIHRHYKEHLEGRCHSSLYACTKCNSRHLCMSDYLTHFEQHKYNPNTCPQCLKQLPHIRQLLTHVYQHIKNNFVGAHFIKEKTFKKCYQCRQCRENVASSNFFIHWESHIKIQNPERGSVNINSLEKKPVLLDVIALLQYETSVSNEGHPKQCVMCFKNFSRKNDMKRHLIEHLVSDAYTNRDKYECLKCQICSVGFNKIDIYKRHMREHGSLPLYKCEICDKTFSDSSNFSKHKKVHNLDVLICDICKKKFTCKAYLIKHLETHDKLKPIVCDCCQRVFHSPSSYRKHRSGRYRFKCAACSLSFTALKDKWDHVWLEHKERKYLADCPICKKSFRKYQDVRMHIKKTHDSKYVYKPIYEEINKNEEVIICE